MKEGARMKSIIVKKCNSHRIAVRFFTIVCLLVPAILSLCFKQTVWIMMLLCSPVTAWMILMLLYYETWKISFDSDGVRKKVFGVPGKAYSYHQIKDVISRLSYTEQGIVRITFIDNRSIKFRLEDENADKARKRILSYHSIRNIN